MARGVCKEYVNAGGPIAALGDVELSVRQGEFVAIVGPSGCGKSTLLRLLAGLLPATRGTISIHGCPVAGPRRDIGVVFQTPVLFPWRTVLENVLLPADVLRLERKEGLARARELLVLVGLQGLEDRYPRELSGGMQQRVGIARSLVHDPDLLLMDEPFSALDALTREVMNVELQRIWLEQRATVVFITHSISEAVFLADRVLVMSASPGRIIDGVSIEASRPRALDVMAAAEFCMMVQRIRRLLETGGEIDP